MPSPARTIFDEFVHDGVTRIERAVSEQELETLYLDFKESATTSGAMTKDDRKNLGRYLSGFANASGGVIVWGVRARSVDDRNPLKQAVELAPIARIRRFADDLLSQIGQVVERLVAGVEVHHFLSNADDASGFAIVYIPASSNKPHMCIAADEGRYYLRSGSQTLVIGHTLVEALFLAQERPRLELQVTTSKVETRDSMAPALHQLAVLAVKNVGEVSAKNVAVSLIPFPDRGYRGRFDLERASHVRIPFEDGVSRLAHQFRMGSDTICYPGTMMLEIEIIQRLGRRPIDEHLVHWRIDAEGFRATGILDFRQVGDITI